jgi:hypothetical protein
MTGYAELAAAPGPAPVAIHNDGDVRGQAPGIDGARERSIGVIGFQRFEQGLHRN